MSYSPPLIPSQIAGELADFLRGRSADDLQRPSYLFVEFLRRLETLDMPSIDRSGAVWNWFVHEVRSVLRSERSAA